ncbi:MAG: adenylate/guanylate cyclase domain-containing protein [Myxococcales bacterium]|nr:adenylate/guanylate cyclase domain-containing protein [Myxococcales bacterium]MCB9749602.1 adenylate/guanylate cyclase domain-containing protein [Myxococcales bacterium]
MTKVSEGTGSELFRQTVLDLVEYVVFRLSINGRLTPISPTATRLINELGAHAEPVQALFGVPTYVAFDFARTGDELTSEFIVAGGQSRAFKWTFVPNPGSDGAELICFSIHWEPMQAMLSKVRRESLMFKELVLNTLPHNVAEALIANKAVRPRAYRQSTVLFTDVVGFSRLAFHLDPVSLIRRLNTYFSRYDALVSEYGVEKIKTIGDSYMCSAGLPRKKRSHAIDCALVALRILDATDRELRLEPKVVDGVDLNNWQIRVGLHSGPCISGVVGSQKYVFDIWGDSVNIAARMESASEASRINISSFTYDEIKDYFACTHRGAQHVKNIGEVEMYFLDGLKPEFAADERGCLPNDEFMRSYCERFRVSPTRPDALSGAPAIIREFALRR